MHAQRFARISVVMGRVLTVGIAITVLVAVVGFSVAATVARVRKWG